MTKHLRPVTVHQLPARFEFGQRLRFLEAMQQQADVERPRLVLDCSRLERMDDATVHLLLCCLEEAMKRNGDMRLAGVNPEVDAVLHESGIRHLFEVFTTPAAAINSYHSPFAGIMLPNMAVTAGHEAESAA